MDGTSRPWVRIRWLGLLVVCVLLFGDTLTGTSGVGARSTRPRPVKRIHHPSSIAVDIIPKRSSIHRKRSPSSSSSLFPDDSLRISFSLPSYHPDAVHIHLKPNDLLLHPQAKINHFSPDGELTRTEELASHRGYHGEVVHGSHTGQRMREDLAGGLKGGWSEEGKLGWASLTVHDEGRKGVEPLFEGAFEMNGQVFHVLSKENWERHRDAMDPVVMGSDEGSRMVIFLEGDVQPSGQGMDDDVHTGCQHDHLEWNSDVTHPVYHPPPPIPPPQLDSSIWSPIDFFSPLSNPAASPRRKIPKRDDISTGSGYNTSSNFINSIGSSAGCPTTQQIVYMGVNADCEYVSAYGGVEAAKTQILTNWNSVSALYKSTFNISLGIIEMNVANETCPTNPSTSGSDSWNYACGSSSTLDDRLSTFSAWRGTYGNTAAGIYHLMSACPTDTEVGVAWLGTVCQTDASDQGQFVSSTGVSTATKTEWSLISHEIGHNFGAIHDCTSGCSLSGSCCPLTTSTCDATGSYIMNPTTSSTEVKFSACTVGNICSLQQANTVNTTCIQSPGALTVLSLQSCGNGIVEDGEECDPGSDVTSTCCNTSTCKFTTGSVCDPSSDLCCTSTCSYATNATVCRAAKDTTCDYAEYCTGTSAACPADKTVSDGTSCGSDGLACADGTCTSLNLQCQEVGASLNLTTACNSRGDTSCLVTCQSLTSSSQCLVLESPLVDGSPCGYGGHCYNQTCQAGSTSAKIDSWYKQNLNIAIPVTIVAGLIILAIIYWLLRCMFCSGRRKGSRKTAVAGAGADAGRRVKKTRPSQGQQPPMAQVGYAPPVGGAPGATPWQGNGAGYSAPASQPGQPGYGQQYGYDNGAGNQGPAGAVPYGSGPAQGGYASNDGWQQPPLPPRPATAFQPSSGWNGQQQQQPHRYSMGAAM